MSLPFAIALFPALFVSVAWAQSATSAAATCYKLESHADQRQCLETLAQETAKLVAGIEATALVDVGRWDQEASYRDRTRLYLQDSATAFAHARAIQCELQASLAAGGNAAGDRRLLCEIEMNQRRIAEILSVDSVLLEHEATATYIDVLPGSYEVEGKAFKSSAELEGFLRARKPAKIRLLPSPGVSYQDVAGALKAIQDVGGADIGLVGNKVPE